MMNVMTEWYSDVSYSRDAVPLIPIVWSSLSLLLRKHDEWKSSVESEC